MIQDDPVLNAPFWYIAFSVVFFIAAPVLMTWAFKLDWEAREWKWMWMIVIAISAISHVNGFLTAIARAVWG